jgi:hypothetical protein
MIEPQTSETLLVARLLGAAVRGTSGCPGVLVRDVPHLDIDAVLTELERIRVLEGVDLRIAYLNPAADNAAQRAGIPEAFFTTKVERAELWRNTADLAALIVVITEEDGARLTSLEEFAPIGPSRLRRLLVGWAVAEFGNFNEVLPRWWEIIGGDEQISFSDLVDYFSVLEPLDGDEVKGQSAQQINRLGLLPDPGFFDNPGERQLRANLEDNQTLALRLANFSEEDRERVNSVLNAETSASRRADLRRRLRELQDYRRGGQLSLTAAEARELLKIRSRKPQAKPGPVQGCRPTPGGKAAPADPPRGDLPPEPEPERPVRDFNGLAVENLLRRDKGSDSDDVEDDDDTSDAVVSAALADFREQLEEEVNESEVRPRPVGVMLPSGKRIGTEVQTVVVNFINRIVGEGRYGGLIRGDGEISAIVQNFQQQADVIQPWLRDDIMEFLDAFAESQPDLDGLRQAFIRFDQARSLLLPHIDVLSTEPLLFAVAPDTRELLEPVIASYKELLVAVQRSYSELHQAYSEDARALVESLMLIDTVFAATRGSVVALFTPLHPLLLWHYFEYATVIRDQHNVLSIKDRALVRSELEQNDVPFFLASIGVPRSIGENAPLALSYAGRLGRLPYFSERATTPDPKDGIRPIKSLIEAFIALHPSAAEGLRLALLDPPTGAASTFLPLCCSLADDGRLRGAHITILRRGRSAGAELNLTSDAERQVQQWFGNHGDRRFTFETRRIAPDTMEPPDGCMPHILVAFDQTERHATNAGGPVSHIQPLASRHRLVYRIKTRSLDLEPALGGILADYTQFAKLAVGPNVVSYPTIHQSEELRRRLAAGAQKVPWYVVADGHVDRDLQLGSVRVLIDQDKTRAVAAFAREPHAFRRILRDVVRQYNTYVKDEELDDLLEALSDLLDGGILSLRPTHTGEPDYAHVKGILGLLVAVQSLRNANPDGYDRIILSLDDAQAQRWLHLSEDRRRADLLVIDGKDDHFIVTVVEVKARYDMSAEYSVSGDLVSGRAVEQVLATHRLLRPVLNSATPDMLMTPSRREIVREHLYRELSKARYTSEVKRRWEGMSRQLFDEPNPDADLRCELIDVQLGVADSSLEPQRECRAKDGEILVPVTLRHLNEKGVPVLEEALTPPAELPPDEEGATRVPGAAERDGGSEPDPVQPQGGPGNDEGEAPSQTAQPPLSGERPRVFIGHGNSGYGSQPREVWFDPQNPDQALNNPHISISGETGSGKTQAVKAIVHDFLAQSLPVLILDFKDDYSSADYASTEGFTVHDASFGALPFNPMVPPVDPQTGRANPIAHVHELGNMLQRIYKLGDQQAFQLRESMKEAYEIAGVGFRPFTPSPDQEYLPFEAIGDVLRREEATTLLGRLSPVFDLGLFSQGNAQSGLDDLLTQPTVVRLSQLPGDQVKNAVAEFFLMALYGFLIRRAQPHALTQLLVLDEAWRLVNSPFLEPLMREGRAFGLGVIIATQFPKDLPDQISGSTATRMYFSQTKAEQVREIQRTLMGKTSGSDAEHLGNLMRGLAPLECVLQNIHYKPWTRLRAVPYFERMRPGWRSPE